MGTTDDERAAAIRRLENKRAFWQHLAVYLAVNAFLVIIWAVASRGHFWPIWVIVPWGIGLLIHALSAFQRPFSESEIQREINRALPDKDS
ncbi:MAG: 2TM domain-containing protein [Acidimicrobiales bacterium]|nr:2TM domain-containing protein [Acidimicrobiales bacterium]